MPKKNKYKTGKLNVKVESQTNDETQDPKVILAGDIANSPKVPDNESTTHDDTGIDVKDLSDHEPINEESRHKEKMASIATMTKRVDDHITAIVDLRMKLSKLQLEEMHLLDGCVDFLQELYLVKPENCDESTLVLETFKEVKEKIQAVFKHFLPSQIEELEKNIKSLSLKNNSN
ncbi:uncharacterized protein LOC115624260 [Scaptodrosophila lebanonensis]|uniref:Uncharacterized protein LOC115624260 n=1 Tax=Drosophila lebanonensis TaxID=7225 RepID=A0A6J2TFG9_DROLE|nr:uncharacterized protein LOC115624260 [Scaptodrosophila lebanonensis]